MSGSTYCAVVVATGVIAGLLTLRRPAVAAATLAFLVAHDA